MSVPRGSCPGPVNTTHTGTGTGKHVPPAKARRVAKITDYPVSSKRNKRSSEWHSDEEQRTSEESQDEDYKVGTVALVSGSVTICSARGIHARYGRGHNLVLSLRHGCDWLRST